MDDENDTGEGVENAGATNAAQSPKQAQSLLDAAAGKAVKAPRQAPSLLETAASKPPRRGLKSHVRAIRDAHFLPTGSKPGARKKVLLKNTVIRTDQLHVDDAHAMIECGDLLDFDPAPAAPAI
jgi:hypothetical protein